MLLLFQTLPWARLPAPPRRGRQGRGAGDVLTNEGCLRQMDPWPGGGRARQASAPGPSEGPPRAWAGGRGGVFRVTALLDLGGWSSLEERTIPRPPVFARPSSAKGDRRECPAAWGQLPGPPPDPSLTEQTTSLPAAQSPYLAAGGSMPVLLVPCGASGPWGVQRLKLGRLGGAPWSAVSHSPRMTFSSGVSRVER